jgi:hypothetical protein
MYARPDECSLVPHRAYISLFSAHISASNTALAAPLGSRLSIAFSHHPQPSHSHMPDGYVALFSSS